MDRNRWPRKLWNLPMEEMEIGALNDGYKDCAQTVRRTMLALLVLCLFTIVTMVGTPDSSLVLGDAKITVPFANAGMVVGGFLFAITLILIVVLAYLHVFLSHLKRLERAKAKGPHIRNQYGPTKWVPMLFTLDTNMARAMSYLAFYWSVPLTLAVIFGKGVAPFPGFNSVAIAFLAIITMAMILLAVVRDHSPNRFNKNFVHFCLAGIILIVTAKALLDPDTIHRPLFLQRVDFSDEILIGAQFRSAQLEGAILKRATLNRANLVGAILLEADLSQASLIEANLQQAFLFKAKLQGANLREANLSGADLYNANLSGAGLERADLSGVNLLQANLSEVTLIQADLSRADLSGADLTGAILIEANLSGADFSWAKLRQVVGLTKEQMDQACGDLHTILPDNLSDFELHPCR
jgi:uncharacterized protein YjbI with pentapeptide repeats